MAKKPENLIILLRSTGIFLPFTIEGNFLAITPVENPKDKMSERESTINIPSTDLTKNTKTTRNIIFEIWKIASPIAEYFTFWKERNTAVERLYNVLRKRYMLPIFNGKISSGFLKKAAIILANKNKSIEVVIYKKNFVLNKNQKL